MIRGLILDIDGVIVGEKVGYNSPDPHPEVIKALREIRGKGIPISLCTAKPHFSIRKIIQQAQLNNYHLTDGGGVIINPLQNEVVKKFIINSQITQAILELLIRNQVYTEYYTVNDYVVQKTQISNITKQHKYILQKEPRIVAHLSLASQGEEITKIMPIARDEKDKKRVIQLCNQFRDKLTMSWGVHPIALPLQFGIITAPGVSKKQGAIEISKGTGIPFANMLGVGDSTSDWQFMELCNYAVAMENASQELKDLVVTKGKDNFYIAPSVDENGILQAFSHFKL